MDETLDYYDNNAMIFAERTRDLEFSEVEDKFLSLLPKGGFLLDFGCGSGRDTKYFIKNGFTVDATDGSEKLCRIAEINTGIKVKRMLFSELDEDSKYDGIWACASILHLPKRELRSVFEKMLKAVKPLGYIYTSFKYSEFEGVRGDRYFTDFTSETFQSFIVDISNVKVKEEWVSEDVRPGRGDEKWLNLILLRSDTV
ncbi:MAG: class I SAM-dependent methyltransferase [Lachnospiraceae bacterium]|nr:class I SAM-dependent methyltransferase [Lachnospiraceae bacterium]